MAGDGSLFTSQDAVEAAWAVVDPVLADHAPALPYAPGSWGPAAADALIAGDGGWHDLGARGARAALRLSGDGTRPWTRARPRRRRRCTTSSSSSTSTTRCSTTTASSPTCASTSSASSAPPAPSATGSTSRRCASELGYADYLGALQRYRADVEASGAAAHRLLSMSSFLIDYPFADRLYPRALDVVARLGRLGPTVILSDGDVVFQPRKIERSGLCDAVDGRVLIYVHKEQMLDVVAAPLPGAPLRDGRRQAAHPGGDEGDLGRAPRHRLSAPGPLRPRPGQRRPLPRRRLHASSASATCSPLDLDALLARHSRRSHERQHPTSCTTSARACGSTTSRRDMLDDGTLARYIGELSITGLTSNPTIFEHAIGNGNAYDEQIAELARAGRSGEDLFFALAAATT